MTSPAAEFDSASRWAHRLAVATACAMFPLLIVGGLVTTYDAGMAVPDWPNTYGYNLFLYPWQTWLFGPFDLFIEHGHRLLGSLVGLLAIGLVAVSYRQGVARSVRRLAWLVLLGVIAQGLLGGFRVLFDERAIAFVHGCFGPTVFALTLIAVAVSSADWREPVREAPASAGVTSLLVAGLAFAQLGLGAVLRHLLLILPPAGFRVALIFHLVGAAALLVFAVRGWLAARSLDPQVARGSAWLAALVVAQIALGASTWIVNFGWPSWLVSWNATAGYVVSARSLAQSLTTTAHVGLGAWIVALACRTALWTCRGVRWQSAKAPRVGHWAGAIA